MQKEKCSLVTTEQLHCTRGMFAIAALGLFAGMIASIYEARLLGITILILSAAPFCIAALIDAVQEELQQQERSRIVEREYAVAHGAMLEKAIELRRRSIELDARLHTLYVISQLVAHHS